MNRPGRRVRWLRAIEIHADDATRVIAIEAVRCDAGKSTGLYRLFARIEPVAIVVCAAGDTRVIGLASTETSLGELQQKVPRLRDLLIAPRAR